MSDMLGLLRSIAAEAEALGADLAADLITQKQARIRIQNIYGLATPTEVEGLRGLGSASALEVDVDDMEDTFRALHDTIDVLGDCEGGARRKTRIAMGCAEQIERSYWQLFAATKPEASPSPENESAGDGAAIRPRAEAGICTGWCVGTASAETLVEDLTCPVHGIEAQEQAEKLFPDRQAWLDSLASTTTAEPSPSPELPEFGAGGGPPESLPRPVSTDREEGQDV